MDKIIISSNVDILVGAIPPSPSSQERGGSSLLRVSRDLQGPMEIEE
jgi:hypothetical protein